MLQNASYMFFFSKKKKKKETKQNEYEKKKTSLTRQESNPQTFDVEGQRIVHCATQSLLRPNVKLIVVDIFVPTRLIVHDGAENADVRRNEYHKRSPLSTKGVPRLGVAFS